MRGSKTIGSNPTVYKYDQSNSTDASASVTLSNIEWDTYSLGIATTSGYSLAESCSSQPEVLAPGTSQTTRLYVLPYTASTLLVDVRSSTETSLSGAAVQLYKTGYDTTITSSACGQAFFENLTAGTYSISVSRAGYQTFTSSNVDVSDVSTLSVVLNAL